jgi:hypothetical protein
MPGHYHHQRALMMMIIRHSSCWIQSWTELVKPVFSYVIVLQGDPCAGPSLRWVMPMALSRRHTLTVERAQLYRLMVFHSSVSAGPSLRWVVPMALWRRQTLTVKPVQTQIIKSHKHEVCFCCAAGPSLRWVMPMALWRRPLQIVARSNLVKLGHLTPTSAVFLWPTGPSLRWVMPTALQTNPCICA